MKQREAERKPEPGQPGHAQNEREVQGQTQALPGDQRGQKGRCWPAGHRGRPQGIPESLGYVRAPRGTCGTPHLLPDTHTLTLAQRPVAHTSRPGRPRCGSTWRPTGLIPQVHGAQDLRGMASCTQIPKAVVRSWGGQGRDPPGEQHLWELQAPGSKLSVPCKAGGQGSRWAWWLRRPWSQGLAPATILRGNVRSEPASVSALSSSFFKTSHSGGRAARGLGCPPSPGTPRRYPEGERSLQLFSWFCAWGL